MQTFYMVLKKDSLSVFEKEHDSFERLYIEGNPEYRYEINCAKECTEKLLFLLYNEFNLDSVAEIDFVIIENEDKLVNEVMEKALCEHIKEKIDIEKLIGGIFQKLKRDKKLHIPEYGINFDGKNYLCKKKDIEKHEFSLLGYTIGDDVIMKYFEEEH